MSAHKSRRMLRNPPDSMSGRNDGDLVGSILDEASRLGKRVNRTSEYISDSVLSIKRLFEGPELQSVLLSMYSIASYLDEIDSHDLLLAIGELDCDAYGLMFTRLEEMLLGNVEDRRLRILQTKYADWCDNYGVEDEGNIVCSFLDALTMEILIVTTRAMTDPTFLKSVIGCAGEMVSSNPEDWYLHIPLFCQYTRLRVHQSALGISPTRHIGVPIDDGSIAFVFDGIVAWGDGGLAYHSFDGIVNVSGTSYVRTLAPRLIFTVMTRGRETHVREFCSVTHSVCWSLIQSVGEGVEHDDGIRFYMPSGARVYHRRKYDSPVRLESGGNVYHFNGILFEFIFRVLRLSNWLALHNNPKYKGRFLSSRIPDMKNMMGVMVGEGPGSAFNAVMLNRAIFFALYPVLNTNAAKRSLGVKGGQQHGNIFEYLTRAFLTLRVNTNKYNMLSLMSGRLPTVFDGDSIPELSLFQPLSVPDGWMDNRPLLNAVYVPALTSYGYTPMDDDNRVYRTVIISDDTSMVCGTCNCHLCEGRVAMRRVIADTGHDMVGTRSAPLYVTQEGQYKYTCPNGQVPIFRPNK